MTKTFQRFGAAMVKQDWNTYPARTSAVYDNFRCFSKHIPQSTVKFCPFQVIFIKRFILVRVAVDPEPVHDGTLVRQRRATHAHLLSNTRAICQSEWTTWKCFCEVGGIGEPGGKHPDGHGHHLRNAPQAVTQTQEWTGDPRNLNQQQFSMPSHLTAPRNPGLDEHGDIGAFHLSDPFEKSSPLVRGSIFISRNIFPGTLCRLSRRALS